MLAEEIEGSLVLLGRALEMQSHLEPAVAGVVPRLEMQLGMTVVELQQAAVTAHQLKAAKVGRQPGPQPLAHASEEVGRGKCCSACQ